MPDKKEDYYKVLGVPKDANETQIKKAYRKGALKWHPVRTCLFNSFLGQKPR